MIEDTAIFIGRPRQSAIQRPARPPPRAKAKAKAKANDTL